MIKKKKKRFTQSSSKKLTCQKKNFDLNLKNWKYTVSTFSDLELDIITKFQEGENDEYPGWFVDKNHEFLKHTAGSGFFLYNQLAVKDRIAKQIALDF